MEHREDPDPTVALDAGEAILPPDTTMLDVLDNVLHKGVVVQGEVVIGLAGIDLVYLGITAVLCAADRVLPPSTARMRSGGRGSGR